MRFPAFARQFNIDHTSAAATRSARSTRGAFPRRWRLSGNPEEPDGRIIEDLAEWKAAVDRLENPIHATFYRFLLFTGLRKTEAFTLEWKNIHKDRIHLPITKNGRSFDLPIVNVDHDP